MRRPDSDEIPPELEGMRFLSTIEGIKTYSEVEMEKMGRRGAMFLKALAIIMSLVLCLAWPNEIAAYAVLSHEAIIDSVWDTHIRPLVLKSFPDATAKELKEAHGYAYGGAIIQDMGYYPRGSFFFSDLTHYVRSGDFVPALLHDSKDLDGHAFALGALAHYASDNEGHPMARIARYRSSIPS